MIMSSSPASQTGPKSDLLEEPDKRDRRPLHAAALTGDKDIIKLLLQASTSARRGNRCGEIYLNCSFARVHVECR